MVKKHYMSLNTRQIQRMDEEDLKKYSPTEYGPIVSDALYKRVLDEPVWEAMQSVTLFARHDPDDHVSPETVMSSPFKDIKKALEADYLSGKLKLNEKPGINGHTILVAEKEVLIRWAIGKGFNIPEIFSEFLESSPVKLGLKTEESELLKKSALKLNYSLGDDDVNNTTWESIIRKSKENGLEEAVIRISNPGKKPQVYYRRNIVEKWLIQTGRYSIEQLNRLRTGETSTPKPLLKRIPSAF